MKVSNFSRTLAVLTAIGLFTAGCSSDKSSNPGNTQAPALPSAERLAVNFDFFKQGAPHDQGQALLTARENFFNAAVRVAVIGVVAEFVLTPPIAAFAVALDSHPIPQPDGSYLWVYTWVQGTKEAQIRLRGKAEDDHVDWEMRVSTNEESPAIVNEVWFDGQTWNDGDRGLWNFYDVKRPDAPAVARLEWNDTPDGDELTLTDLNENPGDEFVLSRDGHWSEITFHDESESADSFIRWNEQTGTGSLKVPDYKGGQEACWDQHQNDVICGPAL